MNVREWAEKLFGWEGPVGIEPSDMDRVGLAFGFVGWVANLNGRRLERAYRMARARWVEILDPRSPLLVAKIAPRRVRREKAKEFAKAERRALVKQGLPARSIKHKFRPIYGYRGYQESKPPMAGG